MKSIDSTILSPLLCAPLSIGCTFLFCAVGSSTTDTFLRFADISYESLWYKFPIDLQQYLRFIIADGQQPHVFQGLGILDLNLMVFTKVYYVVGFDGKTEEIGFNFLNHFSGDENCLHLLHNVQKCGQIVSHRKVLIFLYDSHFAVTQDRWNVIKNSRMSNQFDF